MRREFPAKVKQAAYERAKGHCEECGQKIVGRAEFDHVIPCALGGEPSLENCSVSCSKCHRLKTSTHDIPRISKAKRQRAKHIGATKAKATFPGSRNTPWKRKMNGTMERR